MAKSEIQQENERLARIGHKRCSKCGQAKPFSEYHRWGRGAFYPQCKTCRAPGAIKAQRLRVARLEDPVHKAKMERLAEARDLAATNRRRCRTCDKIKPDDAFKLWGLRPTLSGGVRKMLSTTCMECRGTDVDRVARQRENKALLGGGTKRCKECLKEKPIDEFYRSSRGGLQARCKQCYHGGGK